MRSLSAVAPARRRLRADLSMKSPATIKAMPSTWIVRRMCPPSRSARWPAGAGSSPARWWHSRGGRRLGATVQRRASRRSTSSPAGSAHRSCATRATWPRPTPRCGGSSASTPPPATPIVSGGGRVRPRTASASTRPPSGRAAAGRPPNANLRPAIDRANLTVETDALATGALIEDERAVGVRYLRDGAERVARAGRQHGVPPVVLPRPSGASAARTTILMTHTLDSYRETASPTAGRPCGPGPGSATRSS